VWDLEKTFDFLISDKIFCTTVLAVGSDKTDF